MPLYCITCVYGRVTLARRPGSRSVKFGIVGVVIFRVDLILRDAEGIGDFTVSNKSDFPWRGKAFSVVRGFGILGKCVRKNS